MIIWDGMKDRDGMPVALRSLSWEGEARGLLLTMKTVQSYRNDSEKTIEAVYTFPLAWEATVDSFAVVRDGVRHVAQAMRKAKAETHYEESLAKGEAPAMLEYDGNGLCTVNVGRIEPGESLDVEIGFTKLLEWRRGEVRITIPTVIGERYSSDGSQGNLQPHQMVETSREASYEVRASFRLTGGLEKARIAVPGQNSSVRVGPDGAQLEIFGGYADRDLVITAQTGPLPPLALAAPDGDNWAVVASGYGPEDGAPRPLGIKLLVDCSGSMSGRPIEQARDALRALCSVLTEKDRISLTCFGSRARQMTGSALSAASKRFMRTAMLPAIDQIDSDMGGTEMLKGLQAAISVKGDGDVLIITDGDIWAAEEMIQEAKHCGHRVFLIGVGTSPATHLLEQIARETGGSCSSVMPFEDMSEAVFRMADRMRQAKVKAPAIDWQAACVWSAGLPADIFASESWSTCAVLSERPAPTIRVDGKNVEVAVRENPALARFVADRRTKTMEPSELREQIAVDHALLGPDTNLILVMEGKGSADMPTLAKVPQMEDFCMSEAPCPGNVSFSRTIMCNQDFVGSAPCMPESFAPMRRRARARASMSMLPPSMIESPAKLVEAVNGKASALAEGRTAHKLLCQYSQVNQMPWPAGVPYRLRWIARSRILLAVLLDWLEETVQGLPALNGDAQDFVAAELARISPEDIAQLRAALAAFLPEELGGNESV